MSHRMHSNARTTPAISQEIRDSSLSTNDVAQKYNVTKATARKWLHRDSVEDKSHRPHKLHTTFAPEQEDIVVELCKMLLLPLDDLRAITREFANAQVSRSGLSRCSTRHGVSRLSELISQEENDSEKKHKTFKDYAPGFVHVDLKYRP